LFFFAKISRLLELGTARRVCNVIDLNTVSRVDLRIDLNPLENPDVRFVFFHQDLVNDICLIDGVEDIGRRLRSELCGTDEQHRMRLSRD